MAISDFFVHYWYIIFTLLIGGILNLAVLAPILVFIAIAITTQAFEATPLRYAAAVVFSFFPAIAGMLAVALRIQLAVPNNTFLVGNTYNQVLTLHAAVNDIFADAQLQTTMTLSAFLPILRACFSMKRRSR